MDQMLQDPQDAIRMANESNPYKVTTARRSTDDSDSETQSSSARPRLTFLRRLATGPLLVIGFVGFIAGLFPFMRLIEEVSMGDVSGETVALVFLWMGTGLATLCLGLALRRFQYRLATVAGILAIVIPAAAIASRPFH